MPELLYVAAALLVMMGLVHSVAGELLVFPRLPPLQPLPGLFGGSAGMSRTLRACWHVLTAMGAGLAAILAKLAAHPPLGADARFIVTAIATALAACAALMLAGTRGRHIGWLGFLLAAGLCALALR